MYRAGQYRLHVVRYGRRLSRFDGKQYRNYYRDSSDPDALGNSSVYALYVAAGGELWVGTAGGVYIYDSVHDRFRRFSLETHLDRDAGAGRFRL